MINSVERFANQYSVGKYLRKQKNLRKRDPNAKRIEPSTEMQQYKKRLQEQGAIIKSVVLGEFHLKNGLPYPGLIAEQKLLSNEIFIKIPTEELMTTKVAFFSDIKEIFENHPHFFNSKFNISWEDHILLAFILYQYQQGKDSKWYPMIVNLPREIDYVIFWDEQKQMSLLQDETLKRSALESRRQFQLQYQIMSRILSQYPQYFKPETYSIENFQWVYTHLVSRCFGKYFCYVTMVPFAELLNHECTDVYYDFQYNKENPAKKDESVFPDPEELLPEEQECAGTSDGSYDSVLDENEEQFKLNLDQFSYQIEGLSDDFQVGLDLNETLQSEIGNIANDVQIWMENNLDWDDQITIFFVAQIMEELLKIEQQYLTKEFTYFIAKEEIKALQTLSVLYKSQLLQYRNDIGIGQTLLKATQQYPRNSQETQKDKSKTNDESPSAQDQKDQEIEKKKVQLTEEELKEIELNIMKADEGDQNLFQKEEEWEKDKFDFFSMKCSSKDQFEEGSQVFFCYGRLSNRMLLMRYGFTLEYNKYDHIHFTLQYLKYLQKGGNKKIFEYMQKCNSLSKYKKFKIRRHQFCFEIVTFFRIQLFKVDQDCLESIFFITDMQKEISALNMTKSTYEEFLKNAFTKTAEENEKLLYDETLSYHEYFSVVYRLERQRMILDQIQLINICIEIFKRVQSKGFLLDVASLRVPEYESAEMTPVHRMMLYKYLNFFKLPVQNATKLVSTQY